MPEKNPFEELASKIKLWATELGFQQAGISNIALPDEEKRLMSWLDNGYHGSMDWMKKYGTLRARPNELQPGALRAICVRMNYLPENARFAQTLRESEKGYISRYALGRDYHKLMRNRLKKLAAQIEHYCLQKDIPVHLRPFVDSAPILERPLAERSGIGWVGKHSLLINRQAGSWFFLGELLIDLPLPTDDPVTAECGKCQACITMCPTNAIVAPYIVDARRCISYLTIEHEGAIPVEFRTLMANRIYGCDDCQLVCPWNRFSSTTQEKEFLVRQQLTNTQLKLLYLWSESEFLSSMEGSAIRRIGYQRWLRNITIALGNADYDPDIISLLNDKKGITTLLDEHIYWAIEQQEQKKNASLEISPGHAKLLRIIERGLPRDS